MAAALLASLIPSMMQGALGQGQLLAGLLMKKPKRPDYEIPGEFQANVSTAQDMANGMGKAQYGQAMNNIQRNQAFGQAALRGRRGALAGISSLVQRSNDATLGLDAQSAQMAFSGKRALMGAREAFAQQKLQKWDFDKAQPYAMKLNQKQALIGAGIQNFMKAGDNASAMFGQSMANKPA
jgi:hypothetical protein